MIENVKLNEFIEKVKSILSDMNNEEKDLWIIQQAKLINNNRYDDFLKSLSGDKKIQYMPTYEKIEEFCKRIENKEIYLEYETHYIEFTEFGYYDDFEETFNDPYGIISFFNTVFSACSDLIKLDEYSMVYDIIMLIASLEIEIVEAEDSEDCYQGDYPFTLEQFFSYHLLSMDAKKLSFLLIRSYYEINKSRDKSVIAHEIIDLFIMPFCTKILPSDIFYLDEVPELLYNMRIILEKKIDTLGKIVNAKNFDKCSLKDRYLISRKFDRFNEMLSNIKSSAEWCG